MRDGAATSVLLGVGAVGAAVNGGVFFAFSIMVMPSLDRLAATDPRGAVTAMQTINVVAVRPPLMIALFGTTLVALALVWSGFTRLPSATGWLTLAGVAVFVLGVTVLTAVYHVPLNDALAALGPADDPARGWAAYSPGWTVGNHVRAVAGIVAAGLLAAAARDSSGSTEPIFGH